MKSVCGMQVLQSVLDHVIFVRTYHNSYMQHSYYKISSQLLICAVNMVLICYIAI